ncbi:glycosyltransferase family 2 protein [Planctomycetota bacterium]
MAIPKISVVIPLYNKGKYIKRALDSVFAQTFEDFDLIVIDDGSTDEGPEIVKQYKDSRLHLIQQANSGPGAARNRGIKESYSPYIAFLDADDEWLPEFLAQSMRNLEQHKDCMVSVVNGFVGSDRFLWTYLRRKEVKLAEGPWRLPIDMEPHFCKAMVEFFRCGAVLSRRDVLLAFGGCYENRCTYGEDIYLWLQVLLNHKVYIDLTPLMWWHTKASELCGNRKSFPPPTPMVTDPEPIRKNCPKQYNQLLERFLSYYAILAAQNCVQAGDLACAEHLLQSFPLASQFYSNYIKLRLKIAFPAVIPFFRCGHALRKVIKLIAACLCRERCRSK